MFRGILIVREAGVIYGTLIADRGAAAKPIRLARLVHSGDLAAGDRRV